ncbi:hypothetical protein GFO_1687 [Christiangramia forsetii KT0803]|uniref:Uncharacterized protein n=1 Tax=Christiangramia forsetii (strain DSM 17595 / CGMCC 1.15422 / KT0803) TaxID=411154 RepID=A0M213_CHRFK|nr:hypothetical protein GFO_1687 [Christiangramia forsetii KT0803]
MLIDRLTGFLSWGRRLNFAFLYFFKFNTSLISIRSYMAILIIDLIKLIPGIDKTSVLSGFL